MMVTCASSRNVCEVKNFAELRKRARQLGPLRVGVVAAEDDVALTAAEAALKMGIAVPVLIGDAGKIRVRAAALALHDLTAKAELVDTSDAASTAVNMARDHQIDLLLKGHLRTD